MKYNIIIVALLGVTLCTSLITISSECAEKSSEEIMLKTVDQAISRANNYTGFELCKGYSAASITCLLTDTISNDKTPFLARLINGKEIWLVKYNNIIVGRGSDSVERCFDVMLEPATGKLLSIYSISDIVGTDDTPPEPDAEVSEKVMSGTISVELPNSIPEVKFVDALNKIVFSPARVKIIRAMYANYNTKKYIREKVWKIIVRGSEDIFPLSGDHDGQVADRYLNSLLHAIDGKTGELLYFTEPPYDKDKL